MRCNCNAGSRVQGGVPTFWIDDQQMQRVVANSIYKVAAGFEPTGRDV
jgi:phenolic acid decarboxylase